MNVAVFSTQEFDQVYLTQADQQSAISWRWLNESLTPETAHLAQGCEAVCAFVLDDLHEPTLNALNQLGVQLIVLRSAGFNNLDVAAAHQLGLTVARAAAYSPNAVAEHAVTLLLTLIRKPCVAQARLKQADGRLNGLLGFDLKGKTIGVIGTGRIGSQFTQIMLAFGCRILANDVIENASLIQAGVQYTNIENLLAQSDVVSLHCPLSNDTRQLLDRQRLAQMKPGALLINTARGGLVDTEAMISCLESGQLSGVGLDVVAGEESLFFSDHGHEGIINTAIAQLVNMPNVIMTPHQAFFTHEALTNIAQATLANLQGWKTGTIPESNRL